MNRAKRSQDFVLLPEDWYGSDYHEPRGIFKEIYLTLRSTLDSREKFSAKTAMGGLAMVASGITIKATEDLGLINNTEHLNELSNGLRVAGAAVTIASALAFGIKVSNLAHENHEVEN
ncbi:MAG TPA: hypothetical protein VMV24_00430 [Candidatus Dormibacteraeota bacterium]|nr:hypothetical protein [Candidatus Dormibacteraeota bacterium]